MQLAWRYSSRGEEVESAFIEYRVTKYNPSWRDASSAYIVDE